MKCERCGAAARVIAVSICNFDRQCLSDQYRCGDCGMVMERDRERWNFPSQGLGKEPR